MVLYYEDDMLSTGMCYRLHKGLKMAELYQIRLENSTKYFAVLAPGAVVAKGDHVVIRRDYFLDAGRVVAVTEGDISLAIEGRKNGEAPAIQRVMTEQDHQQAVEGREYSERVMPLIRRHISDLALPMKVLHVLHTLDRKLCTIQFSAESRVDFRELLKVLAMSLGSRIELRQVSVRDETAAVGGIGCCGQSLCCARFLNEFASINVKMAKDQDLTLNSANISGVCGRLKCCLKFEHETYIELQADMPRKGDICECGEGRGRVCDRNLLSRRVTLNIEDDNGNYRFVHTNRDHPDFKAHGRPTQQDREQQQARQQARQQQQQERRQAKQGHQNQQNNKKSKGVKND